MWVGPETLHSSHHLPPQPQMPLLSLGRTTLQVPPMAPPAPPKTSNTKLEKVLRDQLVYSQQHFRKKGKHAHCPLRSHGLRPPPSMSVELCTPGERILRTFSEPSARGHPKGPQPGREARSAWWKKCWTVPDPALWPRPVAHGCSWHDYRAQGGRESQTEQVKVKVPSAPVHKSCR